MREQIFERNWGLKVPERCFMWKIASGTLVTNLERTRRHLSSNQTVRFAVTIQNPKFIGSATDPMFLNGEFMEWASVKYSMGYK
jgi:hypothetical protein